MRAIKFSESELEFLKNHYELELLDAENYVGEIKNILKKLGVIEKEIIKEKPEKKVTPKKVAKKKKATKKAYPVKGGKSAAGQTEAPKSV
jgi:hypothetical protein